MPEDKNLEIYDSLLDEPTNKEADIQEDELTPLSIQGDNVLEDYTNRDKEPSQQEDNDTPEKVITGGFLYEFLKEKGIEDPSKLQFENEDGEIEEVDFNSLSDEEKLNIINSVSDPGLTQHETDVINYLRQNNVTFNQVIDYFSKKAVEDYLAQNPDQVYQKSYTIDDYTDDELYLADLKSKYPEFTDEELMSKLETAKANEALFKKEVDALRVDYKKQEDAEIEAQKQREQQDYDNLVGNLQNILNNFNEVALDSTDAESDVLEIEDSDKQQVLAYLLNQDSEGKSQLVKDLENPATLIELAWLRTQGRTLIDNTTRYWKDLLKEERKEKAKLQKELESYKSRNEQSVVVPKPPTKNDDNSNDRTLDSLWNNFI